MLQIKPQILTLCFREKVNKKDQGVKKWLQKDISVIGQITNIR